MLRRRLADETHIIHDMLPHPQSFFLHLHHIILLILWVVDFLQLTKGNQQMLKCYQVKTFTKPFHK